jgi:AcrR family transcriptional regulator
MGRPSLKKERFEEILDAFEQCVARYGLAGATLEQVALQAGLARPLIRHHVGNRDDLINALINRYRNKSDTYLEALVTDLPTNNRLQALVDRLFDEQYFDKNLVLVTEALIAAAEEYPELDRLISTTIENIIQVICKEVKLEYPDGKNEDINIVATGILGIYFNVDSLSLLGDIQEIRRNSKIAALTLVDSINQ